MFVAVVDLSAAANAGEVPGAVSRVPLCRRKGKAPPLSFPPCSAQQLVPPSLPDCSCSPLLVAQVAAAARIAGKPDIFDAAESCDLALVADHLTVDPTLACARKDNG